MATGAPKATKLGTVKDRNGFTHKTIKIRAKNKNTLDWGRVVLPDTRGVSFYFDVSREGTADSAVIATVLPENLFGLTEAELISLIEVKEGVTIENNPAWDTVKTDDGKDGDTTADDGKNEGTRYNWVKDETLYEVV